MGIDALTAILFSEKFVFCVSSMVMLHIVLAVHELGHLIVGLAEGFRFEMWVVGLLGIKRDGDSIKFHLNTDLSLYGGISSTLPRDNSAQNADKMARMILAGPVASLLFAFVCLLLSYYFKGTAQAIMLMGGIVSFFIVLVTTIPSKTGIFFTDRKRYQRLKFDSKAREIEVAMLNIIGSYSKDNSYKNIQESDIILLLSDSDKFLRFFGAFNLICYQIEMHGKPNPDTILQYELLSAEINKSMVSAFNKEIINQQNRFNPDLNNTI